MKKISIILLKILILSAIFSPPFLALIYIEPNFIKFITLMIALIISYFCFEVYKGAVSALKENLGKALFVLIAESINDATFAIIVFVLFLLGGTWLEGKDGILKLILDFPLIWYVGISMASIIFGTFLLFGYDEEVIEKWLKETKQEMNACGQKQKSDWKRKRRNLILFNPVVLPFTLTLGPLYLLIRICLLVKEVFLASKDFNTFLKKYRESSSHSI